MRTKIAICVGVALIVVGSLWVGPASASMIAVANSSFEKQVLVDGANTEGAPVTDWDLGGASSGGWVGVQNPASTLFTKNGSGMPVGGDGANSLDIYLPSASDWGTRSQALKSVLQAGTYMLTVSVGRELSTTASNYYFGLYTTDNTLLRAFEGYGADLTAGQFVDKSVTFTVTNTDASLGKTLMITLGGGWPTNTGTGLETVHFDNVRLDYAAVPEPGSMAILASGLLGLLCYAWCKRK